MKKLKDNFIFKLVIALITVAIMGVLVYFVFNNYMEEAKNNTKKNTNDNSASEEEKPKYEFTEYDKKKTRIFLNKEPFYLEVINTDAGNVISIDNNALADYYNGLSIKYLILDDYLVLVTTDKNNEIDTIALFNSNQDVLTYTKEENRYYTYNISKPVISERYSDALTVENNKIYIIYTMENKNNKFMLNNNKYLDDLKESEYILYNITKDTPVEYIYEIFNNDGKLKEKLVYEYKLEEYLNK